MTRPYWQDDNSLAASHDPKVRALVGAGLAANQTVGSALTAKEADELGIIDAEDGSETTARGFVGEGAKEYDQRLKAAGFFAIEDRQIVSEREAEAMGVYLWGDQFEAVSRLWQRDDIEGMLWALLAEHPPWATFGSLMRPTRGGKMTNSGNARRYLRRGSEKLGTTPPGLRTKMIRTLVKTRNAASLARPTPKRRTTEASGEVT